MIDVREDKMVDTLFPEQADQPEATTSDEKPTKATKQPKGDAVADLESKPSEPADELTTLRSELEQERKRREDKDKFIGKQGDELGKLRKKLERLAESLGIEGDPEEALKEKQQKDAEEQETAAEQYREQATKWIGEKIPRFKELAPTIKEILKDDEKYGITEDVIKNFEADPFKFPIDFLVSISERAALREENKKLKEQLEALPKKLSQAARTNTPKAAPSVVADAEDVDIYGSLGIYRMNKS